MAIGRMRIAQLDEARLGVLRTLEGELGTYIVALEPETKLADLSDEQVKRIQAKEDDLGVVMLAYKK